jgi:uncharacterized Zn finger protein
MERKSPLAKIISDSRIRGLAGDLYYQRGLDYFQRSRVSSLEESGDNIRSIVAGTEDYAVLLTAEAKTLHYHCECPLGLDGEFCKHCVATALAWLHGQAIPGTVKKTAASTEITDEDVAKALQEEDKATLINLLLERAEEDETLCERLLLLAAGQKGVGPLIAQVRKSLEKAICIRDFVDYHEMPTYAAKVESAIDGVEALFKAGQANGAIDLCETGLRGLAAAIGEADDSDGYITGLMERLQELHLRACEEARPEPETLAGKLFFFELNSEYGEWSNAAENYAEVLGAQGLAAFRKIAEAEWAKIPVRTERRSYNDREDHHYQLTAIMESLARQSGDVEQLVAVLERDLSSARQYLRIAGLYREAGNHDKALAWAERGVASASGHDGSPLRLFVAEEYQRRARHADALRIVWVEFRDSPELSSYKTLQGFARKAEEWDDWRAQAVAYIRRTIAEKPVQDGGKRVTGIGHRWWNRDSSLLVEIFLDEQETEEAWQEARAGGCRNDLWLRLAAKREKEHPEDAVSVYLRLGEQAIVQAQGSRYEPALQLLEKAAALLHSQGRSGEFEQLFETLRQKYKAKRESAKAGGRAA